MSDEQVLVQKRITSTVVVERLRTDVVVHNDSTTVVVQGPEPQSLAVQGGSTALVQQAVAGALVLVPVVETLVVGTGVQGPPGPQGAIGPAGGTAMQRIAGHTVSALRVVWEDEHGRVRYLSATDEDNIFCLLGVTLTAADTGGLVDVQRSGAMDDNGWSWSKGQRVYLGANGGLTTQPAEVGFQVLVGVAVSPTRLLLQLQDPVMLAVEEGV